MEFFFGKQYVFSQWHPCTFIIDGKRYNCAEQYYMEQKAKTFGDRIKAEMVMKEEDPRKQKMLGRCVNGYSNSVWWEKCHDVVYEGNFAKFSQNAFLREKLFATRGKLLVEASPYDSVWGIGLNIHDIRITNKNLWMGGNWLGYVLTKVREDLLKLYGKTPSYAITWDWATLRRDPRIHTTFQQRKQSQDHLHQRKRSRDHQPADDLDQPSAKRAIK